MRWARIEFHGSFPEGAALPTFKGSLLRGVLGHALKRTVCTVRVKVCEPCLLRPVFLRQAQDERVRLSRHPWASV